MEGKNMDGIDVKIIKILQKNARITASEISGEINLSVPAVSERLKKLEATGIIERYTAIVNSRMVKKELTSMMFVTLERPKYTEKFMETVHGLDEIIECHYLAGDYDYVLKVITENTFSLEELITKIKGIQGVHRTRTIVVLSTVKNNYSVSP
jgi:Lrp/AsnC family transcriptional regulator, leucine-responsive regulatory protein